MQLSKQLKPITFPLKHGEALVCDICAKLITDGQTVFLVHVKRKYETPLQVRCNKCNSKEEAAS